MGDQDKNHGQVWYYLRMPVLLVFCSAAMISPVLCLLDVFRIIPSLSGGIYSRIGKLPWPHCQMNLIVGSTVRCCFHPPLDFHEKWTRLM